MNNKWFRFLAVPAIAGGMLLAAEAQVSNQPQSSATQQNRSRHNWKKNRGDRLAKYLGLTDAQKEQAKAVMQEARTSSQPVRQQLKQLRQDMHQAIKANDNAKIQQLSTEQGTLMGQLMTIRNGAFAKIYATLTPEQQTKADQLPARFHHMREHRGQPAQNPNNG